MDISYRVIGVLAAAGLLVSFPAWTQNANRGPGWEYGLDLVYLDSGDASFEGGSSLSTDDDLGLTLTFGYRFSPRLELQFGLDWVSVDYDATIQSADFDDVSVDVRGELEAFTPRVNLHFNFLDRDLTPYVMGGIGYSFIDTNIPEGRVEIGCWWDPWYGQICVPVQDTRDTEAFAYQLGAGVRWDFNRGFSMRFAYEKHWYDFDEASSTPDLDQLKLGFQVRY